MNTRLPKRGKRASTAGQKFEAKLGEILKDNGLEEIPMQTARGKISKQKNKRNEGEGPASQFHNFISFCKARDVPCFVPQYSRITEGIYNRPQGIRCDFLVYEPKVFSGGLAIEAKWQDSSGSVEEKMPYLVENIKLYPCDSIVVIGGEGMTPGSKEWIKDQVGKSKNLIEVFESLEEFEAWLKRKLADVEHP